MVKLFLFGVGLASLLSAGSAVPAEVAAAQTPERQASARELVRVSRLADTAWFRYRSLLAKLTSDNDGAPLAAACYVRSETPRLADGFANAFAARLSVPEIQSLIGFFSSRTGKVLAARASFQEEGQMLLWDQSRVGPDVTRQRIDAMIARYAAEGVEFPLTLTPEEDAEPVDWVLLLKVGKVVRDAIREDGLYRPMQDLSVSCGLDPGTVDAEVHAAPQAD